MYNYYLKYIKYKNKYLSLKGGKTPYIINEDLKIKFLPLNYGDNIITLNNKIIKEGNKELPIYNLNSEYKYVEIPKESIVPTIIDNYYLFNKGIIKINEENEIPFDALFLQNSFNIISKLLQLIKSKYVRPTLILEKIKENIKLVNNIDSLLNFEQVTEIDALDSKALLYFDKLKDSVGKLEFENEVTQELTEYNKRDMTIVLPDKGVSPNNPSGYLCRAYGCQMVAMRYQLVDNFLMENTLFFDNCGYAFCLKPADLRYEPVTIPTPTPQNPAYSYKTRTSKTDYYSFKF